MTSFQIFSKSGVNFGVYEGETAAHALAAMHRDAGYDATVEDGDIKFASDSDAEICGGIDAWSVCEIDDANREQILALAKKDGDFEAECVWREFRKTWTKDQLDRFCQPDGWLDSAAEWWSQLKREGKIDSDEFETLYLVTFSNTAAKTIQGARS